MVTRTGRFQVSKGYSRESVKRDTDRFVEEDFYREQALRRLEARNVIPPTPVASEPPVHAGPAARPPEPEARVAEPAAEAPGTVEAEPAAAPAAAEPATAASERPEPRRWQKLRRQKLRLRHAPQPSWWGRLWRRLFRR